MTGAGSLSAMMAMGAGTVLHPDPRISMDDDVLARMNTWQDDTATKQIRGRREQAFFGATGTRQYDYRYLDLARPSGGQDWEDYTEAAIGGAGTGGFYTPPVPSSTMVAESATVPTLPPLGRWQEQQIIKNEPNPDRKLTLLRYYEDRYGRADRLTRGYMGIRGYQKGGHILGYGGGDRVPAMLEAGEYVIRKEAVREYKPILEQINRGGFGDDRNRSRIYEGNSQQDTTNRGIQTLDRGIRGTDQGFDRRTEERTSKSGIESTFGSYGHDTFTASGKEHSLLDRGKEKRGLAKTTGRIFYAVRGGLTDVNEITASQLETMFLNKFQLRDQQDQIIFPDTTRLVMPQLVQTAKEHHVPVEMLQSMSVRAKRLQDPGQTWGHPRFGINEIELDPEFGEEWWGKSISHELPHAMGYYREFLDMYSPDGKSGWMSKVPYVGGLPGVQEGFAELTRMRSHSDQFDPVELMLKLNDFRQKYPGVTDSKIILSSQHEPSYDISPALLYLAEQKGTYDRLINLNNDLVKRTRGEGDAIPVNKGMHKFLNDLWRQHGGLVSPKYASLGDQIPKLKLLNKGEEYVDKARRIDGRTGRKMEETGGGGYGRDTTANAGGGSYLRIKGDEIGNVGSKTSRISYANWKKLTNANEMSDEEPGSGGTGRFLQKRIGFQHGGIVPNYLQEGGIGDGIRRHNIQRWNIEHSEMRWLSAIGQ